MGITSVWAISSHPDSFIAELSPRLLPAMEADRSEPHVQRRWERWQQASLPDYLTWYGSSGGTAAADDDAAAIRSFLDLTTPGPNVDDLCSGTVAPDFYVIDDVWADRSDENIFASVNSKDYAIASFFHAIGPARAALLPGWCGNFLLSSAEVRRSLPDVERALTFTDAERAAADAQDWCTTTPGRSASWTARYGCGAPPPRTGSACAGWPFTFPDLPRRRRRAGSSSSLAILRIIQVTEIMQVPHVPVP